MRLYFYISRAGALSKLSRILVDAKGANIKNGITGLMSYNKGRYLQIVEGHDRDIAKLKSQIKNDERHSNVQTILDIQTSHRYFGDWGMRLVPLLDRNREFQAFMLEMDGLLEQLSSRKHALTETFHRYQRYSYPSKTAATKNWKSQNFCVSRWPNFNEVSPTPELLSLCSALFNNKMSYEELIDGHYFRSERALKTQLEELIDIECLTTSALEPDDTSSRYSQGNYGGNISNMGFINKMKDFISNRLH